MTVAMHNDTIKLFQEIAAKKRRELESEVKRISALEEAGQATRGQLINKATIQRVLS